MMASVEKLAKTRTAANVESADPFGRVKLVAGDGEEVDAQGVDVERNFSSRLHGVGVKENIVLRSDAADFFERLDGAEFVVGVHHGDQCGLRADGIAKGFRIDETVCVNGKIGNFDGFAITSD